VGPLRPLRAADPRHGHPLSEPEVPIVRSRTALRTAAFASAALLVAGCGSDTGTDDQAPSTADSGALTGEDPEDAEERGNEADVTFVAGMIPHHQGAIEMAALVEDRTDRQELVDLADEIIEVQAAEVEMLEGMLDRLGGQPADADADHGAMGMPDHDGMAELEAAEGEAFDRRFLELMIVHHEGAVDMAEEVLAEGEDAEVAVLAEDVIAAQEAEIDQMRRWLEEWELAEA
jgi:uncharacterized protein (DUF305 family)